jgi:ADP-ribose pyrophosphatase YjhB (NUDIX family)
MEIQVGVKCLFKNKNNEFLFLKRANGPKVNMWDIPGGRIAPMVSLLENLKREVKEETGLEINKIPELIFAQDIFDRGEKHIVRLTFVSDEEIDGSVILSKEHSEFVWLNMESTRGLQGLDPLIRVVIDSLA